MRAYMSDRDGRRQSANLPRVEWLAWSAESEARAILAEMEPQGCGSYQRLTWLGDWSGDVVESLARFIGTEV